MTKYTVQEIANHLGVAFAGDPSFVVTGVAEPAAAGPADLALAATPRFLKDLPSGQAKAAVVADGTDWDGLGLAAAIFVGRAKLAMAGITSAFDANFRAGEPGVHPTAHVDDSATVGDDAAIGPFSLVGPGAVIGSGARIGAHVVVQADAHIGDDAVLCDGVKVQRGVTIGDRFIAHPGVVIGGDGFSYATAAPSAVENVRKTLGDRGDAGAQAQVRVHSLGTVRIGHDVEIGSNSCVDRGTIRDTVIGNGCKFDNLVQVGHNVQIGRDCLICAQVGIAGSSVIGNNVVLGGQTGVSDNKIVGDNVITGGATKVLANVPAGSVVLGYPAVKMEDQMKINRSLRKLPKAMADVADLKKTVSNLSETS